MVHGGMTEAEIEDAALEYFRALGYRTMTGPESAPDAPHAERTGYDQVVLAGRLRDAVARINPGLPSAVRDQAIDQLTRAESQNALAENQRAHQLLTDGVPVEHRGPDGSIRTTIVQLVDWDNPDPNDWLVARQFTVVEQHKNRRPDLVVFLNGLPVGLIELKSSGSEQATMKGAWNQVQTYRADVPTLFTFNEVAVISDGTSAAMGSFTAGWEHYAPWKTIDGREVVTDRPALEVLIRGVFDHARFLDLVRSFVVFSDGPSGLVKRLAKYHQ